MTELDYLRDIAYWLSALFYMACGWSLFWLVNSFFGRWRRK